MRNALLMSRAACYFTRNAFGSPARGGSCHGAVSRATARAGSLGTAPPAAPRCRGYWGGPRFGRDRIGGHDGNRRAGLPLPLRARERLLRRAGARRLRLPVRAHPRLPAPLRVAGGGAGDPLRLAAHPADSGRRPPPPSLAPARQQLPASSLSFMADHLLARYGGPGSATAFGTGGVDLPRAR